MGPQHRTEDAVARLLRSGISNSPTVIRYGDRETTVPEKYITVKAELDGRAPGMHVAMLEVTYWCNLDAATNADRERVSEEIVRALETASYPVDDLTSKIRLSGIGPISTREGSDAQVTADQCTLRMGVLELR